VGCNYSAKPPDLGIVLDLPADCVLSLNPFNFWAHFLNVFKNIR
jgi:hypothetical protein